MAAEGGDPLPGAEQAQAEQAAAAAADQTEAMGGSGSAGSMAWLEGMLQGTADHVEAVAAKLGLDYDHSTTVLQKATRVARAQQNFMQDSSKVMAFAGAALLIVAIAGRVFRRETKTSAKLVSLGLSMMWASQGILLFGETCATETLPGATSVGADGAPRLWPIEGFLAAGIHALQSVLLCILGNTGFLVFGRTCADIQNSLHQKVGLALMGLSFLMAGVHLGTKGKHGKIGFPIDAFTVGFLFSCATDSGFSKSVGWIPVVLLMLRSGVGMFNENYEEAPFFFLSYGCWILLQKWGRQRDAYEWPEQRRGGQGKARGRGGAGINVKPRPQQEDAAEFEPSSEQEARERGGKYKAMMKETEAGAGGVQGLSFVKDQLMVDEDGDEAMEFFEVTDEGLRKRNIPNAQPAK